MFERTAYSLDLVGVDVRDSYYFTDKNEAFDLCSTIVKEFQNELISEDPQYLNREDIMGLSVIKTYFGGVPRGSAAEYSSQYWLKSSVYEDVNKMADELHRSSKSGINK